MSLALLAVATLAWLVEGGCPSRAIPVVIGSTTVPVRLIELQEGEAVELPCGDLLKGYAGLLRVFCLAGVQTTRHTCEPKSCPAGQRAPARIGDSADLLPAETRGLAHNKQESIPCRILKEGYLGHVHLRCFLGELRADAASCHPQLEGARSAYRLLSGNFLPGTWRVFELYFYSSPDCQGGKLFGELFGASELAGTLALSADRNISTFWSAWCPRGCTEDTVLFRAATCQAGAGERLMELSPKVAPVAAVQGKQARHSVQLSGQTVLRTLPGTNRCGASAIGVAVLATTIGGATRRRALRASKRSARKVVTSLASQGDDFDVVVVGAGVSGLTAAHRILKDRPESKVVVTEARDRAGGNITTMTGNGRLWEEGPNSFQPGDAILSVACDIGLQDDIMLADPNSYRFVWWEGALRALPAGPADAVFGDFLSWPGKIRAGLGAVGLKDPMPEKEESVKEFVTRNLGEEAFERLIDPFVSGVYAGDPSTLSASAATGRVQVLEKNAGSLVAGAIQLFQDRASKPSEPRDPRLPEVKGQTVGSFREGLKQFSDALCADVEKAGNPVRLNWKLKKLAYDKQIGVHVLDYDTPEGAKRLRSKALILTAPSYVTASLLKEVCPAAASALEGIRYPRVAAVTVEYPKSAFREPDHGKGIVNGFGQLHPRSQGIRTLGTIYSSSLFPNRMPDDDKIMLLHYIGGARDPELFGGIQGLTEGQLVEATHKDTVETMLHPSEASNLPKALGVRVWDRAIPQLEVGHQDRLDTVKKSLGIEGVEGLYLAGNFVGGVALGRCVEFGIEIATEVVDFVNEVKIKEPA